MTPQEPRNQDQPEDKSPPGATLCSYIVNYNYVQMHAKLLFFVIHSNVCVKHSYLVFVTISIGAIYDPY